MQEQPAFFPELLFSDKVYAHVQTFQHYKIMTTLHSGAYRNKIEMDNTGSIEIMISIVLRRDFLRSDRLLPEKIDSTQLSFPFRIEFETRTFSSSHNSSQNGKIFVNSSNETATTFNFIISLCSTVKRSGTNFGKQFPFLKISFQNLSGRSLSTPRRSANSLVVIRLSYTQKARVFSTYSLYRPETGWLGQETSSSDSLPP